MSRMALTEFEPLGERFFCEARGYRFPELCTYYVAGSAARASWAGAKVEGGDEFALLINLEGISTFSQLGREASAPAGGAMLHLTTDALHMERTTSRFVRIGVPRAVLAPALSDPDAALMSVISSASEPLRLLTGYADLLIRQPALLETAQLRHLAVDHVHDLVALTVGATREAAEIAAGRGLRAARLRAIKADIARNLAEDVSVSALSARHGVSSRYIRKLFEGQNTSLSQFVLGQRLTRVHRMLADPCYADRTITDIAFAVGFGDISTFNREFRRRFKSTPSDVRTTARG
jgi:AraC-like DNA-binding protein